jgi:hypothetical protein
MAAEGIRPVKSPPGLTVRWAAGAKRFQIRIRRGELLEFGIERDRAIDQRARRDEIAALTGVTAQVELNRGFDRVMGRGFAQDFFRRGDRFRAARRVGPRYPQRRLGRRVTNKFARECADLRPFFLFVQHGEAHRERLGPAGVGRGKLRQLSSGFRDHAEGEVTLGVGDTALGKHRAGLRP